MSTVETVRGPVDVSKLGRTLMHEHVFVMTRHVDFGVASAGSMDAERTIEWE